MTADRATAGHSWRAGSVAVVRLPGLSARLQLRTVLVCGLLVLATLGCVVGTLASGEADVDPADVLRYLGGAEGGLDRTIVVEWRLPRVAAAAVFGAALAVSGGIFQSLTRNPLGSPEVIGFNTGAYTGALIVLLVVGGGFGQVTVGALLGGLATALLVYALAFRRGAQGFRLILVGIGLSAMLASFNQWLILQAELETAISAAIWGAGTLNGIRWAQALPAMLVLVPLLVLAGLVSVRMRLLELGDDAAAALGVRIEPTRLALVIIGVALTAAPTAVAGPIAFVALAAPQLARRLTGSAGIALVPAGCMGALLLVAGDLVAQRAFAPIQLPVGVVTVSLGGLYLVWLLVREVRR